MAARRIDTITAVAALTLALASQAAGQERFTIAGFAALRGVAVDSEPAWLSGGSGRFTEGGEAGRRRTDATGTFQAAVGLQLSRHVAVWVHGVAWREPETALARDAGLTEAFVEVAAGGSLRNGLRFRLGTLINRTSRENVAPLWASPYTISFSALNSWIGEEQRLSGLEALVTHTTGSGDELDLSATAFGGNDTLGTLLAWRGWSIGDRLVTLGETLPLPRLATLAPGGPFAVQQAGTTPLDELDGRLGWAARARWQRPRAALLQLAALDNRGDRGLHQGQYAWATAVRQAGAELWLGDRTVLVGELLRGRTGMGPRIGTRVDLDLEAWYALVSGRHGPWRGSVRYERFATDERDGTAEPNDERGEAWTAAVFLTRGRWRAGLELVQAKVERPGATLAGAHAATHPRRAVLEVRARF